MSDLQDDLLTELAQGNQPAPGDELLTRAELVGALRVADALVVRGGRVELEASTPFEAPARRLKALLSLAFDDAHVVIERAKRKPSGFTVRVREGADVARLLGLIDKAGRPVQGMPRRIVSGSAGEITAALRGAVLMRGALTVTPRANTTGMLEIGTPCLPAAMALSGFARRLEIDASLRTVPSREGKFEVLRVRNDAALVRALDTLGAPGAAVAWRERVADRAQSRHQTRVADLRAANTFRHLASAEEAVRAVLHAFEVLGDDVPPILVEAARLRVEHPKLTLSELGEMAEPPLSKDAVAGRIRRLIRLAARADRLQHAA
ncbi:DNA-binding protein WhiA [Tsukamurella tyrosinosolvens]|uniref:DNA-binding protein WhiA n=1 Tax=Tsukamurella tyrosinosolvens TaxID=57704 RepID=UPI001477352B|nr:DNA-binding protein WhiA [Tsukamurella tyrosinosolvens]